MEALKLKYKNLNGRSNIKSYNYGEDFIEVTFFTGAVYRYSTLNCSIEEINTMKKLADKGSDLNSYIMKNVKTKYDPNPKRS